MACPAYSVLGVRRRHRREGHRVSDRRALRAVDLVAFCAAQRQCRGATRCARCRIPKSAVDVDWARSDARLHHRFRHLSGRSRGFRRRLRLDQQFYQSGLFPFFQSILFLLVVMLGGADRVLGPLVGACVVVLLPELLSTLGAIPAAVRRSADVGGASSRTGRSGRRHSWAVTKGGQRRRLRVSGAMSGAFSPAGRSVAAFRCAIWR